MQDRIEGRRAVAEALRSGRPVDRLYVLSSAKGLGGLIGQARENGAVVIECDRQRLDGLSPTGTHQGVIATVAAFAYGAFEDVTRRADGEELFLVVCDGIQDERNLGAVIRTAEAAGAHGVVIPKRRSAALTAATARASAGAAEHIPVMRVPGIPSFLREIKETGVRVYGADAGAGTNALETEFTFPAALVLGNEEEGLHRLTREMCDELVALPMRGRTASLNVSCAAAVLLYRMRYGR
ncbi:MAG: 23S rRNA (guanosine(2251)-2'-O)-methyltransferase RlmB [Oscillospiraceae bacterium]|jgi:23S rRNA (guanosine2251-2'-O)-methyltransferase|nr:23S rRNA (guanosine(2251)-2'-O)-methyltransferase RlmB [Oscillospiraceae bacterium]